MELIYEEKWFYIYININIYIYFFNIYMYLYTSSRVQHVSGKVLRASTETKGELS